jgi:FHS family glucose/mannose:H+ symporter-like MFS transporter
MFAVVGKGEEMVKRKGEILHRFGIYVGFAATGVALTQPGSLLPLLLRRWQLGDGRGGLLLFCLFLGSMVGAVSSRGEMRWSVVRGSVVTALGALWLATAGAATAYAAMAVFGLGLGMTMTSVSLMQSRRLPEERRLEMARLNLVWAMGAVCGPWLALHSWHGGGDRAGSQSHTQIMLMLLAAFFGIFAGWVAWLGPNAEATLRVEEKGVTRRGRWAILEVPWPLLTLVFCATGVEAAAGGWLTAYAQRGGDTVGMTIGAATCLWAGLLVGRAVHSTKWAASWRESVVLGGSTAAMAVALTLLVTRPVGALTLVAAAVLGFAIGPVYPLLLAIVLRHREQSAVFVVAGAGSSVLPLATGAVSGWTHSLRTGLTVPLAAALGMVMLVLMTARAEERS